ncbi:hypothetical protein OIU85_009280 [Salix viminalis]|uniref:Uncharacterized protein n=1 Tax=Salix viminalis TaxID=40686 RepID=A0A9Q0NZI7_SALVM|nr:hypothetical protein OIU85_009280 [Salix viminalis]
MKILPSDLSLPLSSTGIEPGPNHVNRCETLSVLYCVAGSDVSRKASKRGRPMKLAAPVDAPPSLDKPDQIQAQARKSEDNSGKDVLKMISSEAFYNNGSVIQQVGNFIPGWSLMMNGEDASNEFADGVVALSKDENEEEMNW